MSLLELRKRQTVDVKSLIQKTKKISPSKTTTTKSNSLIDRIKDTCKLVQSKLGNHVDDFELISTKERLREYLSNAIKNKTIAIDTETTGLDPICDQIVGLCLYTPNEKPAYVPINHISFITKQRVPNQLTNKEVAEELKQILITDIQCLFFNAKFDIRVMRHQLGLDIPVHWDGFIASKILKENEQEHNLKYLWKKYCSPDKEAEHFTFDKLFEGIPFNLIPINTAYLYAAKDALMTYELDKFQEPYLTATNQTCIDCDFTRLARVYREIELPIIPIVADIEDNGVGLDVDFAKELSIKYHKLLEEKVENFNKVTNEFQDKIQAYKNTHPNTKMENPINISSPLQLAELIYDVLKIPQVSKKQPRGTGVDILQKIDHPISKAILEYRTVEKLLTTYIDKLPNVLNKKTGRVHCNFHQMGTDTGRFSCSEPNLQNIPAKNKEIRKMFVASEGYVLIGADFSQQEPKITADLSNDEKFIKDCASGKDVYGTIASIAFNQPYEDCLEFYLDENGNKTNVVNKEGKERRNKAKVTLLGICYGKAMQSIAEDLKTTEEKATEIYNAVLNNIAGLRSFMEESQQMARDLGYVETKWGRRRHIPEMQLPLYTIKSDGKKNFDPFFDSKELGVQDDEEKLIQYYYNKLIECKYYKQKKELKEKAVKDGLIILDNTRTLSEAERQCVNCVDKDTEILTKEGWKTVFELQITDLVQTYNLKTHKLEWQKLIQINKHYGEFQMYHVKKSNIDCLCTDNHKFIDRKCEQDKLVKLSDIDDVITYAKNKYQRFVGVSINKNDIKKASIENFVWCPTTPNETWVARRNNKVFITGNSRVQGSAADQSKIALRLVGTNKRLKELGCRILLLVHDEVIIECPRQNAKEVSKIFVQCMLDSSKDLRTGAKCDASYSDRWYGKEINEEDL